MHEDEGLYLKNISDVYCTYQHYLGKGIVSGIEPDFDVEIALLDNYFAVIYSENNYEMYDLFDSYNYTLLADPDAIILKNKKSDNDKIEILISPRHIFEIKRYFQRYKSNIRENIQSKKRAQEQKKEALDRKRSKEQKAREREIEEQRAKELKEREEQRAKAQKLIEEQNRTKQFNENRCAFLNEISQKIRDLSNNDYFMSLITNYIAEADKGYLMNLPNFTRMEEDINDIKNRVNWLTDDVDCVTGDYLNLNTSFFNTHSKLKDLLFYRNLINNNVEWYIVFWFFYKKIGDDYLLRSFQTQFHPHISKNAKEDLYSFLKEFINIPIVFRPEPKTDIITLTKYLESIYLLESKNDLKSNVDIVQDKINAINKANDLVSFESDLLNGSDNSTFNILQIDDVDMMTGYEFEGFVSLLFEKMGYQSTVTKKSGDQGIDVILEKNGIKIGVQTKCYAKDISNKAVQEVTAGMKHYHLSKGMVITNRYFTDSAIALAASNDVLLWDRCILREKMKDFKVAIK